MDAAGAELWAFYTVATLNMVLPKVVTDCKGILDTLQGCPKVAAGHKRSLARTWNMLRHALDEDFAAAACLTTWMPSHESAKAIGLARDSDGQPISPLMWRSNRLADVLAKAAAGQNRLPAWATSLVSSAGTWVKHQAAKLGAVTHAANNYETTEVVDGGAIVKKVLRDSTAERPQLAYRKKKALAATAASKPSAMPSPDARVEFNSDLEHLADERSAPPKRSGHRGAASSADAASAARQRKRRALSSIEELRAEAADEARVASWIASRSFSQRPGPTASERMSALRARIRTKQQQHEEFAALCS